MTQEEQEMWRDSLAEALYHTLKEKFNNEFKFEIAKLVALHVGKWLDMPLTVKQVAKVLNEKIATIYKWQERGVLTFDKCGKKKYTISLKDLNLQLSGKKDLTLEHSGNNKSSKVKSGDSTGEAISEQ